MKLPVSGWLVFNPNNGFFELSADVDGRRVDYVKRPPTNTWMAAAPGPATVGSAPPAVSSCVTAKMVSWN